MDDVLERAESWLGSFCEGLTHRLERTDRLVSALAAAVRALRKDRERLDAILARRIACAWDDELGYSVKLENREMVDAWLEWEVSALVGDDAALSARSGEGE